jgi:hypothetical protein
LTPTHSLDSLLPSLAPSSLRAFLRSRQQQEAWPQVSAVWLEFDLPDLPDLVGGAVLGSPLRPSVCAQLRERPEPQFLLETLFPALHGRPLTAVQQTQALRILEALPTEARLLYAFSMLPRGQDAVRLEAIGVPQAAVAETVSRAGAGKTVARAAEAASLLGEVDRPHLSFDLLPDGLSSRVGLEGSFRRLPHREPRWAALFDRLEGAGLCCPKKRRAVFAWPGHEPAPGPGGRPGFLVRSLSHVKVVCTPDGPLEAKVYLLLEHLPPPDRRETSRNPVSLRPS